VSKTFAAIFGEAPALSESKSCSCNFIQSFEDYIREIQANIFPSNLSQMKQVILKNLWEDNILLNEPGPWIPNEQLLNSIEQVIGKKITRLGGRMGELKSECGCDLEWKSNKITSWRLKSYTVSAPKVRDYLSNKDKRILINQFNHQCAICNDQLEKKFQWDHKVPVAKNGTNDIDNYQPLCSDCHIVKFINCKRCKKTTCKKCPLAFPENFIIKE
jgi:hypothetical protein